MRKISILAAFAALSLSLSLSVGMGFAHAQAGAQFMPQLYGGTVMMIAPDGHIETMKMTDSKMGSMMSDMMMKKGHMMSKPMLVMMGGDGKMHMMSDEMMSDGKMMSEHLKH